MNEIPGESKRIISGSIQTETITDAKGRNIEVRKLSRRELMRCMRLWGPAANVQSWLSMAVVAASAYSIEGRPVPMPQTAEQAEGLADILGPEGNEAIEQWLIAQGSPEFQLDRELIKN